MQRPEAVLGENWAVLGTGRLVWLECSELSEAWTEVGEVLQDAKGLGIIQMH